MSDILNARALEAVVAIALVFESTSSGWYHMWQAKPGRILLRIAALFLWLTAGIFIRELTLQWVSLNAFGLSARMTALIITAMAATDPIGVGGLLAVMHANKGKGLVWQLTAESLVNDPIGLVLFSLSLGVSGGQIATDLVSTLIASLSLGAMVATIRTVFRNRYPATLEMLLIAVVNTSAIAYGYSKGWSLIGLVVFANGLVAEVVEHNIPDRQMGNVEFLEKIYAVIMGLILVPVVAYTSVLSHLTFTIADVIIGCVLAVVAVLPGRLPLALLEGLGLGRRGIVVTIVGAGPMVGVINIAARELIEHGDMQAASILTAASAASVILWVPATIWHLMQLEKGENNGG